MRKKPLVNHVALVTDHSDSMNGCRESAKNARNHVLQQTKTESKAQKQKTTVTAVEFPAATWTGDGRRSRVVLSSAPVENVQEITSYPVHGITPLFDGIGHAIEILDNIVVNPKENTSFLVVTITDGQNNDSERYTESSIRALIQERMARGNWTFVFQVPPGHRNAFHARYGVPLDNIIEWENTIQGTLDASVQTCSGLSNYYNARSQGHTQTQAFYTDLSKVTPTKLHQKLDDISHEFRSLTVSNENNIRDFVEEKTKKEYVKGQAFYQLMKPEKIQPQKEILILEKKTKHIWGGDAARNLIKLPTTDTIKVVPGNHANYEIFVQSTSVNRKLSRGTKVLVRKTN